MAQYLNNLNKFLGGLFTTNDIFMRKTKKMLILGDSHIPQRSNGISESMIKIIKEYCQKNGKFDYSVFTGDLVDSDDLLSFLDSITKNIPIQRVMGNMDYYYGQNIPEFSSIEMKEFSDLKIGIVHGHQIHPRGDFEGLKKLSKQMGTQILISGHTHKHFVHLFRNTLLLNPGSCVGAWSFIASGISSFIIVSFEIFEKDITQIQVSTYLLENQINIEKSRFSYYSGFFSII